MRDIKIQVVDYKLFEYEKDFLAHEIKKIGGVIAKSKIKRDSIINIGPVLLQNARRLTYIKGVFNGDDFYPSLQSIRESFNGNSPRTQSRRYGPHGLHEYKGRFNPQVPRSLILSNFSAKAQILDPFMGSGTTLVEARDLGLNAIGVELNPFAFLLAKAKKIYEEIPSLGEIKWDHKSRQLNFYNQDIRKYLLKWFPENQYRKLEIIQHHFKSLDSKQRIIAQVLLSDLLREHSYQEPKDLRIRRRDAVPENLDLLESFKLRFEEMSQKHKRWVKVLGTKKTKETIIINGDSKQLSSLLIKKINGTVSSPPYASALPYVDTYRLSMVALGLITPEEILRKEKELIGARDISTNDKKLFLSQNAILPRSVLRVIEYLYEAMENDGSAGFRKKAVPYSFSRYAHSMLKVLNEIYILEESGSKNLWVLGPNKVKLKSGWFVIQTPKLVGDLAKHAGFKNIKAEPIQAYNRFGIHSKNSINLEYVLNFQK